MKPHRMVRLCTLGTLAALTLALSVLGLTALNAGGEAGVGSASMKIAAGYDRRAERLLRDPAQIDASARVRAERLSRAAIAQYPYDTSAWLRLAYVDSLEHGGLSPSGAAALKRSYDLVAIDPFVGLWRVRFGLENSQALTPELRASVRNEAFALWRNNQDQLSLRGMLDTLHNPVGRLSLGLWLNRLEAGADK